MPSAPPKSLLCCSGSLEGGGSERQLWQLLCGVDRRYFVPQLFLLYRRGTYLNQLPSDVQVHAFDDQPAPRRNWPGRLHRRQVACLAGLIERSATAVVYDRTFHMTLVTAAACRRQRCPRVSVIVSPPSRDFASSRERFARFKRRLLARAYSDRQAVTLAVSASVAEDAEAFYRLSPGTIIAVPSPIDIKAIARLAAQPLEQVERLKQLDQQQHSLASTTGLKPLRIVSVARLTPEKGMAVLLKALSLLKQHRTDLDVHLDILGDGPLRPELDQLVNDNKLHASVRFHGFQPNPYPWMQAADVVCIPSLYEGLPNVALEAMALAIPVLISHCNRSVQDLIGNDLRGQLFPPGEANTLARELAAAADNCTVWRERAHRAQIWVAQHHSLTQWLERMADILTEAMQRRPRGEGSGP